MLRFPVLADDDLRDPGARPAGYEEEHPLPVPRVKSGQTTET
jgi:hypothetical protein